MLTWTCVVDAADGIGSAMRFDILDFVCILAVFSSLAWRTAGAPAGVVNYRPKIFIYEMPTKWHDQSRFEEIDAPRQVHCPACTMLSIRFAQ